MGIVDRHQDDVTETLRDILTSQEKKKSVLKAAQFFSRNVEPIAEKFISYF